MMTEGHLFSAFVGYKLTKQIEAGISFDGVIHKRDGGYLNSNSDEYGITDKNDWSNSQSQGKGQEYSHKDFAAGINYLITPNLKFGVKAGTLNGKANQAYSSGYSYFYQYNIPGVSDEWNYNMSNSSTIQNWNQDGNTKYFGFNLMQNKENKQISCYYKYSLNDINLSNYSSINDTSFNTSRYYSSYDTAWYNYNGYSFAHDSRAGIGNRTEIKHEGLINFKWDLTPNYTVYLGAYFNSTHFEIVSNEPVKVIRESEYNYNNTRYPEYNYHYFYSLYEDKALEWNYSSDFWTLQIPVIVIDQKMDLFLLDAEINQQAFNGAKVVYGIYTERFFLDDQYKTENINNKGWRIGPHIRFDYLKTFLLNFDYRFLFHISEFTKSPSYEHWIRLVAGKLLMENWSVFVLTDYYFRKYTISKNLDDPYISLYTPINQDNRIYLKVAYSFSDIFEIYFKTVTLEKICTIIISLPAGIF